MPKTKKIPVYRMSLKEEGQGLSKVSFVEEPAMESTFIALSKKAPEMKLSLSNDKQILTGALIIPDKEILRVDEDGNPFFITFSKEDIEEIRDEFLKSDAVKLTNKEHKVELSGNHLVEAWIVEDEKNDKSLALGIEVPKGTLMASYKIKDNKFWEEEVKEGSVKGFSLEGMFASEEIELNKTKIEMSKTENKVNPIKGFLAKLKKRFESIKLSIIELADGKNIELDDETLEVFWLDEEGNRGEIVPDGTYEDSEGKEFEVVEGKRVEEAELGETEKENVNLKAELAKLKAEKGEVKVKLGFIQQVSKWEIEVTEDGEIKEGTKLKQKGWEEGEEWTLTAGEYELESGTLIQVDGEGVVVLVGGSKDLDLTEEEKVEATKKEEVAAELAKTEAKEAKDLELKLAKEETIKLKAEILELKNTPVIGKVEDEGITKKVELSIRDKAITGAKE